MNRRGVGLGATLVVFMVAATAMLSRGGKPYILAWDKPACTASCTTINLSNTGSHQTPSLTAGTDYIINLPTGGPLVGGITIAGGRNVIIQGGEIDLTYPCAADGSNCMGIYIARSTAGEVYIEGVLIKNPTSIPSSCTATAGQTTTNQPCSTGDAIGQNTPVTSGATNVTLQNIRAEGVSGCSNKSAGNSNNADHTDVYQPYQVSGSGGSTPTVHIDHMTGNTNCQGIQIDPDLSAANPGVFDIRATNMNWIHNPYVSDADDYLWWFTGGPPECTTGGVTLSNGLQNYGNNFSGTLATNSVWPDTAAGGGPSNCLGVWTSGTSTYSFPNTNGGTLQITGTLKSGTPPGGDYVPSGGANAGIGYVASNYH